MSAPANRPRWLLQLLLLTTSLGLGLALLGGLELALRVVGVGAPDPSRASRLKYQQIRLPLLVEGRMAEGARIWRPDDIRLPWQTLQQPKPPGGLRVLVFGGSATAGLGYSPNASFPRYLERMLSEHSPGRAIEVANLGIVALSSRQVKLLVADACARYQPDLVVVYSGNNEFLEIHAEKYARATAGPGARMAHALQQSHLFRTLDRALGAEPDIPSLAEQDFSNDDLRLTQQAIVREIEMEPEERTAVVDAYAANLEQMVASARAHDVPILLASVASNWKWRGREDLPEDWLSALIGEQAAGGAGALHRALELLDQRLREATPEARSALLFQRAVAAESLGDFEAARRDYRAAMNQDPHLRRALDVMNERLREVAMRGGARHLDSVALLARTARHGIIGFDEFYDYVHFTPQGALRMAAGLLEELAAMGLIRAEPSFSAADFTRRELASIAAARVDRLELPLWLGIGDEPSRLHDRDLWKYERLLGALDRRIEREPDAFRARAQRGNARYFELRGGDGAERDYRAALATAPTPRERAIVERSLQRLLSEVRP